MAQLIFMPWCHLDREYSVGDITLIPFGRDYAPRGIDALTAARTRLILRSYRSVVGSPVRDSVLYTI